MSFEEAMREAALAATDAVNITMRKYAKYNIYDEPEISTYLIARIDQKMEGEIGGLQWTSTIVRNGSGSAAEEARVGADMLFHVSLDTPLQKYSKGVLVQTKKADPYWPVSTAELNRLNEQCDTMLSHTASAFVFNYANTGMRCGPATRFAGSKDRRIHKQCTWTTYRFFRELFMCPIGDPRITSANVGDLPVPKVIHLHGEGILSDE